MNGFVSIRTIQRSVNNNCKRQRSDSSIHVMTKVTLAIICVILPSASKGLMMLPSSPKRSFVKKEAVKIANESVSNKFDRFPISVAPCTNRQVTIRNVNNWSHSILPLQHYHGDRLPPPPRPSSILDSNNERIHAQERAAKPLSLAQLHILYRDDAIVVIHKPSGALSVPGPRRNPNMANLLHQVLQLERDVDKMVVHRLDMDTSGIVVYALDDDVLRRLHEDFRERTVKKTYHALVCGHVSAPEGEIDLPLERDPHHVPFMRVCRDGGTIERTAANGGVGKLISQAPKPSLTYFRVMSREYLPGQLPVTRMELTPYTGRTHQLRVHCASMGHAIVGDDIYGHGGAGSKDGGVDHQVMENLFPQRASSSLQESIHALGLPLCLHAERLCMFHPISGAPMMFSAEPNF